MTTHLTTPELDAARAKSTIQLAHVDVDYTRRLDPDHVITKLNEVAS